MIKCIVIEDEKRTANYLCNLLLERDLEVVNVLTSVEESLLWLAQNEAPDLIFSDIELGDGKSFDIFNQLVLDSKIIFVTAYDQYSIEAFKHNSIHYLLKPIKGQDLDQAIEKYQKLSSVNQIQKLQKNYKNVFLIKSGYQLKTIRIQEIAFVFSELKTTFIRTNKGEKYFLDQSLENFGKELNPRLFFQINRQMIIHFNAISEMTYYSSTKLKIALNPLVDKEIFVSRDRIKPFKEWLKNYTD